MILGFNDCGWKSGTPIESLRIKARRPTGNPLAIKTAVGAKNMAMRVKPKKIPQRLDGDDRPRKRSPLWKRLPEKQPQGFPDTVTQFRKKRTIIKKITPEDLGATQDKMSMGNFSQNLPAPPFAKLEKDFSRRDPNPLIFSFIPIIFSAMAMEA